MNFNTRKRPQYKNAINICEIQLTPDKQRGFIQSWVFYLTDKVIPITKIKKNKIYNSIILIKSPKIFQSATLNNNILNKSFLLNKAE